MATKETIACIQAESRIHEHHRTRATVYSAVSKSSLLAFGLTATVNWAFGGLEIPWHLTNDFVYHMPLSSLRNIFGGAAAVTGCQFAYHTRRWRRSLRAVMSIDTSNPPEDDDRTDEEKEFSRYIGFREHQTDLSIRARAGICIGLMSGGASYAFSLACYHRPEFFGGPLPMTGHVLKGVAIASFSAAVLYAIKFGQAELAKAKGYKHPTNN